MEKEIIEKRIEQYKHRKQQIVNYNLDIKKVASCQKLIRPVLRNLLAIRRIIHGQTVTVLKNQSCITSEPVIYAVTHVGAYDFEMVMQTLKTFFYTLAGDWELMYGRSDDYFFRTSGAVYVDTEDKEDRKTTLKMNVLILQQGISLLWFPEGIWNLSQNLPMLNLYSGIITAASQANVDIVPIAVDQRENDFYINIGKNIKVNELMGDKKTRLRDIMATLKWEIWESLPLAERKSISEDYYQQFLDKRLSECDYINMEIIRNREYKNKTDISPDEVFSFMNNLEVNSRNQFLYLKNEEYVKKLSLKGDMKK